MRTFVHLLLLLCAIAVAVGTFGPLIDSVEARHVPLTELREGLPAGRSLDQIQAQSVTLQTSLAVVLLAVAAVILLAALFGSRFLGWLAVLVGLVALGILAWRLDNSFDKQIRADYHQLFSGTWGLYAVGGGLIVALLCLLVPRERRGF